MAGKHDGKVVIVTGGGGGIGAATCEAFAREGAKVAALDIDERLAEEAAERLRAQGAEARAYRVDVSASGEVDSVFADVQRELGGIMSSSTPPGSVAWATTRTSSPTRSGT